MLPVEDEILKNFGGLDKNNLDFILNKNIDQDDNSLNNLRLKTSYYYSHNTFIETLCKKRGCFSILSLNCQSLNAKFDSLLILIDELKQHNIEIGAICLQETWLSEDADMTLFQIPNFNLIIQGKHCSQHGGLAIYLNELYKYETINLPDKSKIWEGLFIKIPRNTNGKNIYLGNIYRPPNINLNNEVMQTFIDEISNLLTQLNRFNSDIFLSGDFNIDLLKVEERANHRDFLDNMISSGLLPLITLLIMCFLITL